MISNDFKLAPFQERSVEHICSFFNEHDVYLLADETGLGKTVIASEIIQRLCKDETGTLKNYNIVYIASNLELAKENVKKKLLFDGAVVVEGRLSMLWHKFENSKQYVDKVKLFALTPEVSLNQKTDGTAKEREKCEDKYNELLRLNSMLEGDEAKKLQAKISNLKQKIYIANSASPDIDIIKKYSLHVKYVKALNAKQRLTLFDYPNGCSRISDVFFSEDKENDYKLCVRLMLEICLKELLSDEEEISLLLQLDTVKKAVKRWSEQNDDLLCKKEYYEKYWGRLKKEIVVLPDESERDYIKSIGNSIKDIIDSSVVEIKSGKTDTAKLLNLQICTLLQEIYKAEYLASIRTYMSLFSLEECVHPDIVVIDEIQNYPEIFSENNQITDERSQVIRLVIDSILHRNMKSAKKQKILMLSATPYAYRNAIESDDSESDIDELDEFTKHLVGMEDILNYMVQKNGGDVEKVKEAWENCQHNMQLLVDAAFDNDENINELHNNAKEAIEHLRMCMISLGISRTERPIKSFTPESGKYTLNMSPEEMADYYMKGKRNSWSRLALSLPRRYEPECLNGYEGIKGASHIKPDWCESKSLSTRMEAFLNDLFENNSYLYIFMPPNYPHKKLEGIYAEKERKYGKTLVFSAFNAVPSWMQKEITERWEKLIINRFRELHLNDKSYNETAGYFNELFVRLNPNADAYLTNNSWDKNDQLFEDTIRGCGMFKTYPGVGNLSREDRLALCSIFMTDYAKKIILCLYGEKACSDYWDCVDDYCINGNLGAVLEEFAYMRSTLKKRPCFSEYFRPNKDKTGDDQPLEFVIVNRMKEDGFSTSFSSSAPTFLEEKLESYNSPFYPFCFVLTSVAEEGHDFHFYADRIVHWNVPASPIALVQREGRIDRCDCMAVRKEMAEALTPYSNNMRSWKEDLIPEYVRLKEKNINERYKDMFPRFIVSDSGARIRRFCYYYKFSSEDFRWNDLMKNLEFYRSMFGACDNLMLTDKGREAVQDTIKNGEKWNKIKDLALNLLV